MRSSSQRFRQTVPSWRPAAQDDAAYLWHVAEDKPQSPRLKHASDIVHVTFDSDGKQLATSSIADKKSCVWDVAAIRRRDASADAKPKYAFEHDSRVNRGCSAPTASYWPRRRATERPASGVSTAAIWLRYSTTTEESSSPLVLRATV